MTYILKKSQDIALLGAFFIFLPPRSFLGAKNRMPVYLFKFGFGFFKIS